MAGNSPAVNGGPSSSAPNMNGKSNGGTNAREEPRELFEVMVSAQFLIFSFLICVSLSFGVGRLTRAILLETVTSTLLSQLESSGAVSGPMESSMNKVKSSLPPPIALDGKPVPRTIYTSKNFDTARSATSSSLLIRRSEDDAECLHDGSCVAPDPNDELYSDGQSHDGGDEEEHLPAGQHLLVDIQHVEAAFLNSEERLAHAMVDVVKQANLTLLSYHCHTMVPSGVSCVGVLLESHVSFHTWPGPGVITLDLFTCGSNPLLPVVPIIERLFGVPRALGREPVVVWSHKLRGFRQPHSHPLQAMDLGFGTLGVMNMEYKKELTSVQTKFQRIDIYDVIVKRFNTLELYTRSLSNDGSYEAEHPELYKPDRIVFLDGVLQSRRSGEHIYHEALVHPAMLAHPNPRRVAIIGGGEGATLREVLKHGTVETAIMIEIDELMVDVSRRWLPEWGDCSDLVGSSKWCGDDPRAELEYTDGIRYFLQRYGGEKKSDEKFDVIIVDALDPHDDVEFCDELYNNEEFLKSLFDGLSDDGTLVIQVGESPHSGAPPEHLGMHKKRAVLIELFGEFGFNSLHIYGEARSGLTDTWNYVVAFKSQIARRNWFRNEAEINLDIRKRLVKTRSGESPLVFFDGATMVSYQLPSKRFENVYCRIEPMPEDCIYRGFDPTIPNANIDMFEVKKSTVGDGAGRGVFAKVDIPEDSYIAIEHATQPFYIPALTFDLVEQFEEDEGEELRPLEVYMHGYGFQMRSKGAREVYVDSAITTFINHGCNGTNNIGAANIHEHAVSTAEIPSELDGTAHEKGAGLFNPVMDRHLRHESSGDVTLRNIAAGEEILDNYVAFSGNPDDWEEDIQDLRRQCSGVAVGEVTAYEQET